jgi:hypothetical protein
MEIIMMELSTVLLLTAMILSLRRQRATAAAHAGVSLKCLEDVAENSELTKKTCLSSLEIMHNNLAAIEVRTAAAERRLASLMEAPAAERKEQYQAAAMLIAAGHGAARTASLLNLSVAQVEMIGELKSILDRDAALAQAPNSGRISKRSKKKSEPRSAKSRVRSILLTDAVEAGGAATEADREVPSGVNGAAA